MTVVLTLCFGDGAQWDLKRQTFLSTEQLTGLNCVGKEGSG